jgi:hypothetical protein
MQRAEGKITLAAGRSYSCPTGSSVSEFGFQLDGLAYTYIKGTAIAIQAWTGPEGSR